MLSVIIPALNEEKTIAAVVRFCLRNFLVTEVIVVDDTSTDATAALAAEAGAKVIVSKVRGKGISMRDGINAATNSLLVFLDGDIDPYPDDTITLLASPLLNNQADFVKATFSRNAGRVTALVAKPLLNIFYPALANFSQPLSGMVAGKKSFFNRVQFFNDYGVDVGILLDMYLMKARIQEVNIGYIENKSKSWEGLGTMSSQVAKAIIAKAQRHQAGPVDTAVLAEDTHAMPGEATSTKKHKLAIFDMDDTILNGRFIDECAKTFGFSAALADIRAAENGTMAITKQIALLLKGKTIDELLNVVHGMPMVSDVKQVVQALKQKGYTTGIISNSYTLITDYVIKNIGADFACANQLEFINGIATGEVHTPSYFFSTNASICGHDYCKTNAVQYMCSKYNAPLNSTIIIGDSQDDRCMVGHAGTGVAFGHNDALLGIIARLHLTNNQFEPLLAYA